MTAAVRPYATAGVALLGVSVIAISPLAPPLPDVHAMQRTVSSVGVELSAAVDPIQNWIQVFQKSAANLGAIGQQIAASPAPILSQIVANQIAAFEDLRTRLDANAGTLRLIFDGAPNAIATARGQLQDGDITGAFDTFNNQIVIPLALAAVQAVSDLTRPLVSSVNNYAKAFATLPDDVFQVILPMTFPLVSTINAAVQATQDVYDGVVAGDPGAVFNTLVNLPANLVDGFLNGSGTILGFINAPGLLTPYDPNFGFLASGPISSLIALRDVIAQAIGAPVPTAAAAKAPAAAKTVALSIAPEGDGTASSAKDVTKAVSETAAGSTAADTTGAAADATESATGSAGSAKASTKATPTVTAASATDTVTGGSSSSDTKAGSSATGGSDSKAGTGKKGSGKSGRSAKASK